MDLLIRRATIVDPSSPFHLQTKDLLIQNGRIADIGDLSLTADQIVEKEDLHISAGWIDVFAHFCDPGNEYCETLTTGAAAAAAGGYTDVLVLPNTQPVVHNKSAVEYIKNKTRHLPVNFHPIGAVTTNTDGKELSEMYDMESSGAVAFGDGWRTIQSAGLLLKALQYVKAVDKTIIQVPGDTTIAGPGLMHEGVVSTQLGLAGIPAIAEELMVQRDIELARYAGARIHFTGVSTAQSLNYIQAARSEGVQVTCSVTPYHLVFTDEDLRTYDTNLKLSPPLRTDSDRQALRKAMENGLIDCLATHHIPRHTDDKMKEFEYAKQGMIGLETSFAALRSCLPDLPLVKLVELLTAGRNIFGLPSVAIAKGATASISLFQPGRQWTAGKFHSRSKNSPFIGKSFTGKPLGIINKEQLILND